MADQKGSSILKKIYVAFSINALNLRDGRKMQGVDDNFRNRCDRDAKAIAVIPRLLRLK